MNAVSLLCEIIAQAGKVAAQTYRADERFGALLDAGLISREGIVQSVICENCDAPHDARVIFEGGAYGHYCPEIGFVPVEQAHIVALRPNFVALVSQLRVALECQPGDASQLGPQTWRIGLVDTPGGRSAVYFHPRLQGGDDLDALDAALRKEIRRDYALVLSAIGRLQHSSSLTFNLDQLLDLNQETRRLRANVSVAEAVGAPPKKTGGRPNNYRDRVLAILAERLKQGSAKQGRNVEAEAVIADYVAKYPGDPAPRLPTVKGYVSDFRRG